MDPLRRAVAAIRTVSTALAVVGVLALGVACGGPSVPGGPAIEAPERGDCDAARFSVPPSDEGQTPPQHDVRPGDTPQPGCPEAD